MTHYPLTFSQENRFKKYHAAPLRTDQNMFRCVVILDSQDPVKISNAVNQCFGTIPSVWASFHAMAGTFIQRIHEPHFVKVEHIEGTFTEESILPVFLQFARSPFALDSTPLWRAAIASLGEHYALCISVQHIGWDYYSWPPFFRTLGAILNGVPSAPSNRSWRWLGEYAKYQRQQFSQYSLAHEHDRYFRDVLNEHPVQPQQLPQRFADRPGVLVTTRIVQRKDLLANSIMEESPVAGYCFALCQAIQRIAPLPIYQIFSPINGRPLALKEQPGFFSNTLLFNVHDQWLCATHGEKLRLVHQIRNAARYRQVPHIDDGALQRQGGRLAFTVNIVSENREFPSVFRHLPIDRFTLFGDVQLAIKSTKEGDSIDIIGSPRCFDSASLESFANEVMHSTLGHG
ncbi:condensation domain-containing protein [Pseudomonas sp. LRF_L74]|uniref:condensation domain-containing protein n=1 Tax=Pseudomonas sp. LRF_L74 TaxID=3369422 RepID=UPI003F647F19